MKKEYLSVFKRTLSNLLDDVVQNNNTLFIKTEKGNAVVISESNYKTMINATHLEFNEDLVKKIKEGETEPLDSMKVYSPHEAS